jgi:hypothetical protein
VQVRAGRACLFKHATVVERRGDDFSFEARQIAAVELLKAARTDRSDCVLASVPRNGGGLFLTMTAFHTAGIIALRMSRLHSVWR